MEMIRNLLVPPNRDYRLQAILQLGTNPHYKTVRAVGHTLYFSTGQKLLASTPCNWHLHWFFHWTDHLLTTQVTTITDRDYRRRHKSQPTSERTQLYTYITNLSTEDNAFSIFLLQPTNSDLKTLNPGLM